MPEDVVRIGPWLFSKPALDIIFPILTLLLGSLVTYLTTWHLDRRRWKRERGEKFVERQREALEKALGWVDPMRQAYGSAEFIAGLYLYTPGAISEEKFRSGFPRNLLSKLTKLDIPVHLRPLLPSGTYSRGHRICRLLDDAFNLALSIAGHSGSHGKLTVWQKYEPSLDVVKDEIDSLENDLTAAYRATFT